MRSNRTFYNALIIYEFLKERELLLGEGLPVQRLEKLNRYETHLDRRFERTLAMLVKLKELRGND